MKNLQFKKVSIFYVFIILFCGLLTSGAVFAFSEDVDFIGTPRPQGDFVDLGAFEYVDNSTIPTGTPPTINGVEDQTIGVGAAFNFDLSDYVTEPDGDEIAYTLDGGSDPLPAGLTLNADGSISGTPTEVGTRIIAIRVTDKDGQASQSHTDSFELSVVEESSSGNGGGSGGGGCFITMF